MSFPKPTIRFRCASARNGTRHRWSKQSSPIIRLVRPVLSRVNGKRQRRRNDRGDFSMLLAICAADLYVTRHCHREVSYKQSCISTDSIVSLDVLPADNAFSGPHVMHNFAKTGDSVGRSCRKKLNEQILAVTNEMVTSTSR